MAIPVQPVNMSGLAALAGTRTGGLGLKTPGSLGLERQRLGAQMMQSAQANALAKQQMAAKQQQDAIQNAMQQERLALAQKESDMNSKYKEAMIGQLDRQAEQVAKSEKKEKLAGMAGAASIITQMSPQDLEQNKSQVISGLVSSGLIGEEDGNNLAQMGIPQLQAMAKSALYVSDKALKIKQAESKGQSGTIEIRDPNTGALVYKSVPTDKATTTEQQKKIVDSDVLLNNLEGLTNKYADKYLTYEGRAKQAILKVKDKFGQTSKEDKKSIADMTDFTTQAEQIFQQYRKATTGAQASDREIKMLREIFLNPEMSPSEFKSAMGGLIKRVEQERNIRSGAIGSGIQVFKASNGKEYSDQDLAGAAAKMGISVDELKRRIQ